MLNKNLNFYFYYDHLFSPGTEILEQGIFKIRVPKDGKRLVPE